MPCSLCWLMPLILLMVRTSWRNPHKKGRLLRRPCLLQQDLLLIRPSFPPGSAACAPLDPEVHGGGARHIDGGVGPEGHPLMITMAMEKPWMSGRPLSKSATTTTKVRPEVMMVPAQGLGLMERSMISAVSPRRTLRKFSRARSNTTMVSFRE